MSTSSGRDARQRGLATIAIALGFTAACCFGSADSFGGLASRHIRARTVVFAGEIFGLLLLAATERPSTSKPS